MAYYVPLNGNYEELWKHRKTTFPIGYGQVEVMYKLLQGINSLVILCNLTLFSFIPY